MRKIFFVALLAVGLAGCDASAFLTKVRQGAIARPVTSIRRRR
jgi:hypothetical protein